MALLSDTEPRMVLSDKGGRVTEFNSTVVTVSVFFVIQCWVNGHAVIAVIAKSLGSNIVLFVPAISSHLGSISHMPLCFVSGQHPLFGWHRYIYACNARTHGFCWIIPGARCTLMLRWLTRTSCKIVKPAYTGVVAINCFPLLNLCYFNKATKCIQLESANSPCGCMRTAAWLFAEHPCGSLRKSWVFCVMYCS